MLFITPTMEQRIREIFTKFPETKDDDNKLTAEVFKQLISDHHVTVDHPIHLLLEMLSDGKLGAIETIRRTRQWLQEKHPELRGNRYDERHGLEKEFREQLTFGFVDV